MPELGARLGDFELLDELGRGAHGRVYLARQVSLDRRVALKVSEESGEEARAMAPLEHSSIVQVYSESRDPSRAWRLLCMQYVEGATLEGIIAELARLPRSARDGKAVLDAVDRLSSARADLDPRALRSRRRMEESDFVEAVSILGARLAEALSYAHARGVLHRDVKPANILVNPYGRPLLADFSVAALAVGEEGADLDARAGDGDARRGDERARPPSPSLGGTLLYMAPEHIRAFVERDPRRADRRSDLWSLGAVLYELIAGTPPYGLDGSGDELPKRLRSIAASRMEPPPPLLRLAPGTPSILAKVIERCLDPDPERRHASASDLARALDGCRQLRAAERRLPTPGRIALLAARAPFLSLIVLATLPHLVGSAVNILYNSSAIVRGLDAVQRLAFRELVVAYNSTVYPVCLLAAVRVLLPCARGWRRVHGSWEFAERGARRVRRRCLRLAPAIALISALGWLPGALAFPVGMDLIAGPLPDGVYGRFALSFAVSGLIAMTYSYFAVELLVLRAIYPRARGLSGDVGVTARDELRSVRGRVRFFRVLAGAIPLAGAALLVGAGPEDLRAGAFDDLRVLVTVLIGVGMAGFWFAGDATTRVEDTVSAYSAS